MIASLKNNYFFNLLQQYRRYNFFLPRKFSKISPIDNQPVQKKEEKNVEGLLKQEENPHKNVQYKNRNSVKVCIIGGGVTPLYTAVLLKQYQIIKAINLVDTRDFIVGALTDCSHIESSPRINYYRRKDIKRALKEVNIVALMDEMDSNNMATDQARFRSSTDYVRHATDQLLRFCPDAVVAVFVRPVTATLAMVSEIFRCSGWWNPDRIIGSTAMHNAQIEEITAALLNLETTSMSVPLAGGADLRTIVPLLSRAIPFNQFTNNQCKTLLQSFRASNKECVEDGPSLSSGTAAAKLIIALAAGLCGFDHIITCAYVRSNVLPVCRYFTSQLQLGPEGIKRNLGLPKISPTEVFLLEQTIPLINANIDMAIATVQNEKMRVKT